MQHLTLRPHRQAPSDFHYRYDPTPGGPSPRRGIDVVVSYAIGGMNYFAGAAERRGIRIAVTPVTLDEGRGSSVSLFGSLAESGAYAFVQPLARYNARRLQVVAEQFDADVPAIAALWSTDAVAAAVRLRDLVATVQATLGVAHAA